MNQTNLILLINFKKAQRKYKIDDFEKVEKKVEKEASFKPKYMAMDPLITQNSSPKLRAYDYIKEDNNKALEELGQYQITHNK